MVSSLTIKDESVFETRYFNDELWKKKFKHKGLLAMANDGPNQNASNFFITLSD